MQKVIAIVIALGLLGCEINPSKYGKEEAQEFVKNITYVQDARTGLCFALVASRKTGELSQTGMGISEVPCNAVINAYK